MTKIRLTRLGKKHKPQYRIVVMDSHTKRDGKYIEKIGFYNPFDKKLEYDNEKLKSWIGNGAQMTNAVKKLLKI